MAGQKQRPDRKRNDDKRREHTVLLAIRSARANQRQANRKNCTANQQSAAALRAKRSRKHGKTDQEEDPPVPMPAGKIERRGKQESKHSPDTRPNAPTDYHALFHDRPAFKANARKERERQLGEHQNARDDKTEEKAINGLAIEISVKREKKVDKQR